MNDDFEIEDLDEVVQNAGVVERVKVSYTTSIEDDEVVISLGSEKGKVKENKYGGDDLLYTIEEELEGEYPVPESSSRSPNDVAESVLGRYAETDDSAQWAVKELA